MCIEDIRMSNLFGFEDKWRSLTENAPNVIIIANRAGKIQSINRTISGQPVESVIGRSIYDFTEPASHNAMKKVLEQVFQTGETGKFETKAKISGKIIWFETYVGPVKIGGKVVGATLIATDIAERKRAEERIVAERNKLENIMESMVDGITIIDPQGRIVYINQATVLQHGYTKEEAIGRTPGEIFIDKQDVQKYFEALERSLSGELISEEFKTIRKNGTRFQASVNLSALKDTKGKPYQIIAVHRDITKRKRAEEAMRGSEKKYRTLVQSINDLILVLDENDHFSEYYPSKDITLFLSPEEFSKKNIKDLLPLEITQPYTEVSKRVRETGKSENFEYFLRLDYRDRWFSVNLNLHENGKSIVAVIREITKRKQMEAAIQESEKKYRNLVEKINEVIYTVDQKGIVSYVSPSIELLIGYSPSELMGRRIIEFVHQEDLPRLIKNVQSILSGQTVSNEYRILTKSGEIRWVRSSSSPIYMGNQVIGLRGLLMDMTERKQAEAALRSSEERYRTLFDTSPDGIVITTVDGNFLEANQAYQDMLGYTVEELKDIHFRSITPEKWHEPEAEAMKSFMGQGYGTFEKEYIRKDGKVILIALTAWLIKDKEGNPIKIGAFVKDITERQQAEEQLQESEEKYRFLINNLLDEILEIKLDGTITYVSPQVYDILGYTVDDVIGTNALSYTHPDDLTSVAEAIKATIETQVGVSIEFRLRHKNGHYVYVSGKGNFVTEGKTQKLVALLRDITDRKRTELELQKSEEKYRHSYNRANFYKDLFAHDINNILQNILTSLEVGLHYMDDPEQSEKAKLKLNNIGEQVERGASLVVNVQKFSMLDEVKSSFKSIKVLDTLNLVIKSAKIGNSKKPLDIRVDCPDKSLDITANELLIDVFENIIGNAVRHNENSRIEISIQITRQQKAGKSYLKMEFKDNGIGIEDNRKELIFERGYKGEKRVGGRGLGLSLVKQIITSYSGHIWVEDRVQGDYSKGSNFIILIPEVI